MPNIFNFLNILKTIHFDRKKQLENQKKQDEKLKFLNSKCPENIIKYYYFQRVLNRVLTKNLNDSDIISYLETLEKNYKIIDDDMNQFEKIVSNSSDNINSSCKALYIYNQKYLLKTIIKNIPDYQNYPNNSNFEKYLGKY